jgi:secondary thiamine-phosphate synthase enzyme
LHHSAAIVAHGGAMYQTCLRIDSPGRGTCEITAAVQAEVKRAGLEVGLCNLFIQHTSASLIVCENADPAVRQDLERFFGRLVPDGDPLFRHDAEGPDDMPAHVRSILTQTSLSVPIRSGRLALGTWQGIYLWEHRYQNSVRNIILTAW